MLETLIIRNTYKFNVGRQFCPKKVSLVLYLLRCEWRPRLLPWTSLRCSSERPCRQWKQIRPWCSKFPWNQSLRFHYEPLVLTRFGGSTWKGCQFRRHRGGLCWWRQGRWSDPPWRPCWRPLPAWPCPLGPSTGSAPETRPPSGASLPHSATGGYLSIAVWCSLECPRQWSPRKPVVSHKIFTKSLVLVSLSKLKGSIKK